MLLSSAVVPTLNLCEALGSNPNTRNKQMAKNTHTHTHTQKQKQKQKNKTLKHIYG